MILLLIYSVFCFLWLVWVERLLNMITKPLWELYLQLPLTRNTGFHHFYLWMFLPVGSISWRQKVVGFFFQNNQPALLFVLTDDMSLFEIKVIIEKGVLFPLLSSFFIQFSLFYLFIVIFLPPPLVRICFFYCGKKGVFLSSPIFISLISMFFPRLIWIRLSLFFLYVFSVWHCSPLLVIYSELICIYLEMFLFINQFYEILLLYVAIMLVSYLFSKLDIHYSIIF